MHKITKVMRGTVFVCLLMSLSACGFHLRGNTPLIDAGQTIHVSGLEGSFADKLHDALVRSGAQVVKSPLGADMQVAITQARSNRTVGTLDERGIVDSYQLFFTVAYSVLDSEAKPLGEPKLIKENRQYVFSPELVVESEFEERALIGSMEDDVVARLIRQLSVLTNN